MGFLLPRIIPPARFLDIPERLFPPKSFQRDGGWLDFPKSDGIAMEIKILNFLWPNPWEEGNGYPSSIDGTREVGPHES